MAAYREVAINEMVGTVERAMRQVLDCWAELPPEMQHGIDQFRTQLGAAIDAVCLVKRPGPGNPRARNALELNTRGIGNLSP